jgi:hypothetical protein
VQIARIWPVRWLEPLWNIGFPRICEDLLDVGQV